MQVQKEGSARARRIWQHRSEEGPGLVRARRVCNHPSIHPKKMEQRNRLKQNYLRKWAEKATSHWSLRIRKTRATPENSCPKEVIRPRASPRKRTDWTSSKMEKMMTSSACQWAISTRTLWLLRILTNSRFLSVAQIVLMVVERAIRNCSRINHKFVVR